MRCTIQALCRAYANPHAHHTATHNVLQCIVTELITLHRTTSHNFAFHCAASHHMAPPCMISHHNTSQHADIAASKHCTLHKLRPAAVMSCTHRAASAPRRAGIRHSFILARTHCVPHAPRLIFTAPHAKVPHVNRTTFTPHRMVTTPPAPLAHASPCARPPSHFRPNHHIFVTPSSPLCHPSVTPPSHIRHTSVTPPSHLRHTSVTPPSPLRYTSVTPPSHLRHTSVTPPSPLCHTSATPPSHLRHPFVTLLSNSATLPSHSPSFCACSAPRPHRAEITHHKRAESLLRHIAHTPHCISQCRHAFDIRHSFTLARTYSVPHAPRRTHAAPHVYVPQLHCLYTASHGHHTTCLPPGANPRRTSVAYPWFVHTLHRTSIARMSHCANAAFREYHNSPSISLTTANIRRIAFHNAVTIRRTASPPHPAHMPRTLCHTAVLAYRLDLRLAHIACFARRLYARCLYVAPSDLVSAVRTQRRCGPHAVSLLLNRSHTSGFRTPKAARSSHNHQIKTSKVISTGGRTPEPEILSPFFHTAHHSYLLFHYSPLSPPTLLRRDQ
jgi:hypothetical protein